MKASESRYTFGSGAFNVYYSMTGIEAGRDTEIKTSRAGKINGD
jgi:hypothetical protein